MIESAKIRNVINEFNNLEKSIYAFKVIKDRLPGDVNNDGILDSVSYIIYPDNTFKFPYNGTDKTNNHYSPDVYSAPLSVAGEALKVGDKVTLDATGTKVTATTVSGVFEITQIDGTEVGNTVLGMFRR